jgi:hypothetical protein
MKNSNLVFHDSYCSTFAIKKLDNHFAKFLHAIFQTGTYS